MALRDRIAGFVHNDVDYAPFGAGWLKGVTPGRFLALFLICGWPIVTVALNLLGRRDTIDVLLILGRGWMRTLVANLPLFLLVIWADRFSAGASTTRRVAAFALAVIVGSIAHPVIQTLLAMVAGVRDWRAFAFPLSYGFFLMALMFGGIFSAILFFACREREATRKLQLERLAHLTTERAVVEARLQALNAQIEPHFLFNSLSSVKRLYEQERGGGRELLRSLGAYMRSAVELGRRQDSTLGAEVDLATAFFRILGARMGERLQVRIDVPDELRRMALPALILGTLVENAVKHGIGPRASGGTIEITARAVDARLVLRVADDGLGFHDESGTGVGLANTRARLRSLYGEAGVLDLQRREGGGVVATVSLPLRAGPVTAEPSTSDSRAPEASPARAGFAARFRLIITWKHWAWMVAIFMAVSVYGFIGHLVGPNAQFSAWKWVETTAYGLISTCLFMLAVVAAEAWRRDGMVKPRHHAATSLAAAVACLFLHSFSIIGAQDCASCVRSTGVSVKQMTAFEQRRYNMLTGLGTAIDGILGTLLYIWLRDARRASAALAEAEIARAEADRRLMESRLEAAQAEVDPAFVFRTLELVEHAYERDRVAADAMLDELIAFLRAAIPKVRSLEGGATGARAQAATA